MSTLTLTGSSTGTALLNILNADDIEIGTAPSYQLCKIIYLYHPLGQKMAESPLKMAQAQPREVAVPNSPEDRVVRAFREEWVNINADRYIFNLCRTARIYGVASIALLIDGVATDVSFDYSKLHDARIAFNIFDPLNSAGSMVLNQTPTAIDFQKVIGLTVEGQHYHRSRFVAVLNEEPVYLAYTDSAFGFVGRSVYQRALFPLKSFLQTMITDDLVSVKAGVVVAMLEQAGSVIDNVMVRVFGMKRQILKEAKVGNVISIGTQEKVETLNFRNMDGPYNSSRANILKNIATAADMPAKLLENETFVEGFGEGTEDAKAIAAYIDGIRTWMQPAYDFFTKIAQYRAWNPKFYEAIQKEFPDEYGKKSYNEAFYEWVNSFTALWPSLLKEPPSKQVEVDRTRLETVINMLEAVGPQVDPENKAKLIEWAEQNVNALKNLFSSPLELDYKKLKNFTPETMQGAEGVMQKPLKVPKPKTGMGELYRRHSHSDSYYDEEADSVIADLKAIRDSMLNAASRAEYRTDSDRLMGIVESMKKAPAPIINVQTPDVVVQAPDIVVNVPPVNVVIQDSKSQPRAIKLERQADGSIKGVLEDATAITRRELKIEKQADGTVTGKLEGVE